MKILHLNAFYPPIVQGGAERSVAMLAEAQARAGHDVAVACITSGDFSQEVREGVRVFRMPHESAFWSEDWPNHSPLRRLWRKAKMPFNRRQRLHFERVLELTRPDIVHSHSMNDVTTSCWAAVKRGGHTLVHTLRDYDLLCVNCSMYHDGKPCGLRCHAISAPKKNHHYAIDAVVGISEEVLRIHRDHGLFSHIPPERHRVIWNSARVAGSGPEYRKPDRTGLPFAFGFLGRLTEEKGIGVLIEAAQLIPNDGSWEIVVAGRAPKDNNQFAIMASGLPITFLGQIDPIELFNQIDLLVAPSIWAEPFGRIVIEAYSVDTPVLVADSGGLPGLVVGNRADWVIPAGDAAALAARMQHILAEGRASLPGRAMFAEMIRETAPSVIAERYLNLYRDLMV